MMNGKGARVKVAQKLCGKTEQYWIIQYIAERRWLYDFSYWRHYSQCRIYESWVEEKGVGGEYPCMLGEGTRAIDPKDV